MRFNSKPSVVLSGDTVMISFSLSWDHSWRDDFNWDAVWVFGKYGIGTTSNWRHLKLLPSGHSMPSGFTFDTGNADNSPAGGVFLIRSDRSSGPVNNQQFTIKTLRSHMGNVLDADLANNEIFISLSAIEMVYIPYGGYYLGDDSTANRLGSNNGGMIAVNSEDALSVYPVTAGSTGAAKSLPATFPKGYKGFYCMKYEVSQEQYVGFLNNLTRAQQKARIGNNLDELKVGEYVFGDKYRPNYRNGICVLSNLSGQPAIFGCNLNPADPFSGADDGQCIACNYLTPADMLAYCDWACLRPMSELEYEKACRKPYPQQALGGEFVWNSTSGVSKLNAASGLVGAGTVGEKPSSVATNVNYNNGNFGPVRSGSFGSSSSTQSQAGASFWGLMEMSGNVAEMCYSVNAGTTTSNTFNTSNVLTSHGNGEINASNGATDVAATIWSNATTSFMAKGGSFASTNTDELKISDRSRATIAGTRDSTIGFRGVHTFGGYGITVNAGTLSVPAISCAEGITVSVAQPASITWNGVATTDLKITYVWYVQKGDLKTWELLPGEISESLTYVQESFSGASMALKFKRTMICAIGEATTAAVSTTVPNLQISFNPTSSMLKSCDATLVTATVAYTSNTDVFSWTTETGTKTGASYTPAYEDFLEGRLAKGNKTVKCDVSIAGCGSSSVLSLVVIPAETGSPINFTCGSGFTDYRNSQVYPTVLIDSQCWMSKNMNIGEKITLNSGATTYTSHQTAGIQKICYSNNESNCTTYGGLYFWAEAVNGEQTGTGAANEITAKNKKCAVDGSGHTQGICPDGWHIPSDAEFKTLEMSLNPPLTQAQADATEWRGTNQGTQLKSSSGWNGLIGGNWDGSKGAFYNFGSLGLWWSSSEYNSSTAWRRNLSNSYATVNRLNSNKSNGMSVRCLLN